MFRKSAPSDKKQVVRFRGIDFTLLESVEVPAYYTNWSYINYLERFINDHKCTSMLDMFAGSGAIGFSIADVCKNVRVDTLDANIHAVRSMRETLKNNPHINASVTLSECFGAIRSNEKKFDLIVGNPPHLDLPVEYPGQINGRDPSFKIHADFFNVSADYLNAGGNIVLVENSKSNVLQEYYPHLPRSLTLKSVIRLPDNIWDVVIVTASEKSR